MTTVPPWLSRAGILVLGWALIAIGLAALVLPGPGLLALTAGLVVLSLRYAWAKRLLIPIKARALKLAANSVQTWPRIIWSSLLGLALIAIGIIWGIRPAIPEWWPLSEWWWLPGGWNTAVTLMGSGVISLVLIIYSFIKFRPSRASTA
jgi:hypothetical protein